MIINTHYLCHNWLKMGAQHLPLNFLNVPCIIYFVLNAAENDVVFLKLKKKSLFQLLLHT